MCSFYLFCFSVSTKLAFCTLFIFVSFYFRVFWKKNFLIKFFYNLMIVQNIFFSLYRSVFLVFRKHTVLVEIYLRSLSFGLWFCTLVGAIIVFVCRHKLSKKNSTKCKSLFNKSALNQDLIFYLPEQH